MFHVAESAFDQGEAIGEGGDQRRAAGNRVGVTVDGDDIAPGSGEQAPCIAAGPEGSIDIDAAIARLQCRQHFREHHRSVPGIGAGRRHDIRYGEQITNAKSTMLRTALTNRFVATPVKGRKKMPAGL